MASSIQHVGIIGAGGNSGRYMAEALLKTGKQVTAISRADSTNSFPDGLLIKRVDYNDSASLVAAMRGLDVLIITLSVFAPHDTSEKLIRAAAEARVPWILPNAWGVDSDNEALVRDVPAFGALAKSKALIQELGVSKYIAVGTGFWYEWSLAIPDAYGFDFENRAVVLFDDGATKIPTSTWPQVGRAVAALLSLPVSVSDGPCLEKYQNSFVYVKSFTVSQNDMLESVLRVTGSKLEDWTITSEPSKERYRSATELMAKGDRRAFGRAMYTRMFYQDGSGNFERTRTTLNAVLGLPTEDIDKATEAAIKRAKEGRVW